ncbi:MULTISPECIES: DUF5818 domain-containing protein [Sphingobium]|jgi:hypothetical protein|uniref:DUF5818 domain-containing protein n=1 Tax=Sphingobium TaxID=165695 RepID=UPI0002EC9604|nr:MULTISPECIES: DUF5818 domain-containing protein [Sphingobium]TKV41080.1 hypothetical protein A0U87_22400 [Sphingobium sp. MP9-4]
MPRGTRHELFGILLGGDPYTVLRVSDGGEWRLDCPGSCRHLLGQKVRVVGTRSDFDMLDVEQIEPA